MTPWLPRWFACLCLVLPFVPFAVALEWLPLSQAAPPDAAEERLAGDLKLLRDAGVATDGPGLVEFFRKQTVTEEQRRGIAELIKQLGDNSFKVRENATAKLKSLGPAAVPALQQALNHRDVEVVRRAEQCLNALKDRPPGEVRAGAARVLTARKPAGAVEALLAFLPDATDPAEEDTLVGALTALGVREGKADPALVAALTDKLPLRRAVAAEVLAGAGRSEHRAAVRKLLADSDRGVRLHVAVALTYAGEREAVPVLIDATADLSRDQAREAHELLRLLAGASTPKVAPGGAVAARRKFRDDWNAWWKEHGAEVKLAGLDAGPPSKAKAAARASASWAEMGRGLPDDAFAFEAPKGWNAGGYAPQWIEADLGAPTRLASLWMNPCQVPAVCDTTHEIWVSDEPIGDERTKAKLVHTFKGQTENRKPLKVAFAKGLSARYVQIRTTQSASWVGWNQIEVRVGQTRARFVTEGP